MDWALVEAARDLGASPFKAFLTVTLKLTLPGLLSGVILTFIPSMGLFFIADILGGNKIVLVGSLIQDQLTPRKQLALRGGSGRDPDDSDQPHDLLLPEDHPCERSGGTVLMKKKKFKFSHLYLGLVMAITYPAADHGGDLFL